MRVLVTGAKGQVGAELVQQGNRLGYEIIGLSRSALDIRSAVEVEHCLSAHGPGIVVNAAAYTAVESAEDEVEQAFSVNRDGPQVLSAACSEKKIPLIHYSTDYVFDGDKSGLYVEDDMPNPINVYGRSKWEGEVRIRETHEWHVILRTSWVFGMHSQNFVKKMLSLSREKEELTVVGDLYGCPTSAAGIAEATMALVGQFERQESISWGTYHYCGSPSTSWFGFAKAIFENEWPHLGGLNASVIEVSKTEFKSKLDRPVNTAMSSGKLFKTFGIPRQSWADELNVLSAKLTSLR